MALYAVYYQTGVSPLDGEPLCTVCLITQSEAAATCQGAGADQGWPDCMVRPDSVRRKK